MHCDTTTWDGGGLARFAVSQRCHGHLVDMCKLLNREGEIWEKGEGMAREGDGGNTSESGIVIHFGTHSTMTSGYNTVIRERLGAWRVHIFAHLCFFSPFKISHKMLDKYMLGVQGAI